MNRAIANPIQQPGPISESRQPTVSRTVTVLSYLILAGGIFTAVLAAYLVMVTYSRLPAWDGWIEIHFAAERNNQSAVEWLWTQHWEHRLLIPKLFLLVDLYWFRATQGFLLASIFVIQTLHLIVLGCAMRVLGGWRGAAWRTGFGLAAFCLFGLAQWENLTWGFQTCFVLPGFFASLSFFALMLYWKRLPESGSGAGLWRWLLLSIAAALGATYSLSNGNLVWPLLVVAALVLRLRFRVVLALALTGLVSTALYLNEYVRPANGALQLESVSTICRYLIAYFGSAWVQVTGDIFKLSQSAARRAELVGVAALAIFLFQLLKARSYIRSRCSWCVQLVLLMSFCVGTGVLTALGRSFLGIGQAFASRYQTVVLLFWCCLGLLWLANTVLSSPGGKGDRLLWTQVVLLFVMVFAGQLARTTMRDARVKAFQRRLAGVALLTGVADMEQLRWADYHPDQVLDILPYLRAQRLSVFSEAEASLLGKPVSAVFHLTAPGDCIGQVASSGTIYHGGQRALRINGWTWDAKDGRPPAEVVLASNGIITGLGVVGDWRPSAELAGRQIPEGYTGFSAYAPEAGPVEVYAVLTRNQGTACYVITLGQ